MAGPTWVTFVAERDALVQCTDAPSFPGTIAWKWSEAAGSGAGTDFPWIGTPFPSLELTGIFLTFAASAAVATRRCFVKIVQGAITMYCTSSGTITANQTRNVWFGVGQSLETVAIGGAGITVVDKDLLAANLVLLGGNRTTTQLQFSADNVSTGDAYTQIAIMGRLILP